MRLIDADELRRRMYEEAFEKDSEEQRWDSGCWIRYRLFEKILKEQPTIEPEPKKGRWIKPTGMMPPEHTGRHCCSECYEFAPVDWKTHKEELTDYCPHCGLKMEVVG